MGETDSPDEITNGSTRLFPPAELPAGLFQEPGIRLSTAQAVWHGLPGDRKRLAADENGSYGSKVWAEITQRLNILYPDSSEAISRMLGRVKTVHDAYLKKSAKLPPHRKTYYHNLSAWEKAEGHADQAAIGTAREIIGALAIGDVKVDAFPLERLGAILQAMMLHDIDWDLADSKQEARSHVVSLLGNNQLDADDILHVINLVDYSRNGSQYGDSFKALEDSWGKDQAHIVREIVRRNDLLQTADERYADNKAVLATDFALRHPEYLARWGTSNPLEGVPLTHEFAQFAEKIIFGDTEHPLFSGCQDPFRYYHEFFGTDQPNPAETGWRNFKQTVPPA